MKKQIISLALIVSFAFALTPALAGEVNDVPDIEFTPQEMNYETQYPVPNQTQYPLPSKSYKNQGYDTSVYQGGYYNDDNKLKGNVVMVPIDTTFSATTMTPISSETLKKGDTVTMYVSSDFYYNSHLIAAEGSRVNGTVLKVSKGGLGNRYGKVDIKFTNIVTPYGQVIPISANIKTDDGSGVLKAGTAMDVTKGYITDAAVGAAAGALFGTALGAISSSGVGYGAIYGTALGGGMALLTAAMQRGNSVEVPQGATMDLVITQPITVSVNNP